MSKKALITGVSGQDGAYLARLLLEKNYQVFDRKCDHAGGKIITKNSRHICPMHNWEFLPKKGKYRVFIKSSLKKYELKKVKFKSDILKKSIRLIEKV